MTGHRLSRKKPKLRFSISYEKLGLQEILTDLKAAAIDAASEVRELP